MVWKARVSRPKGPPRPADAARDRQGLREAVKRLRARLGGRIYLGGQSYGGRQASMLAAEEPGLVAGLLLVSYPLHPPGRPAQLRTAHLARLRIPALFVHGRGDSFGSIEAMRAALAGIRGPMELMTVQEAGHELKSGRGGWPAEAAARFRAFCGSQVRPGAS